MKLVLERRGDAEIAPAPAQSPKEIGVLVAAGRNQLAFRGYEIDREKVVASQSIAAHQPAEATAQRQAGYAGAADQAASRRQAEGLGFMIQMAPQRTAFCTEAPFLRIDADTPHFREVQRQTSVANGIAGNVVTTASHRKHETALTSKIDGL